jgi:type I restriction enzyme S subunit
MSEQTKLNDIANQETGVNFRSPSVLTRAEQLPSGWDVADANSITKIKTGHTPSTDTDEYWNGNIPWIAIHDLSGLDTVEIDETEDNITEEGLANSGAKLIPEGALALCRTGSIGESAILNREMATDQSTVTFECYPDLSNPYFLMYIFQWCQPELERLGIGSTHPSIQLDFFPDLQFLTPPLSEQRKIATVLYTVDQAIEKTQKAINSLSNIKLGVKQDIFATGLSNEQDTKETRIGEVSSSWEIRSASEVCDEITVGIVSGATEHYVNSDDGVPFVRSKNVREHGIDDSSLRYISKRFNEQNSKSILNEGDVLTVRTGVNLGESCVVNEEYAGGNCFSLIISRPGNKILSKYLQYYINSKKAIGFIDAWKAGGGQNNFNIGSMRRLPIPIPPIEIQEKVVEILDNVNEEIEKEQEIAERLSRIKRGLMQDLSSGKVRTTDTNIEVPDEIAQHG